MRKLTVGLAVAAAAIFASSSVSQGAGKKLTGTVGPGFTISLSPSKGLQPGTYTLVVNDKSKIHNFHIFGPGVNKSTTVKFVGRKSFTIRLKKGTYKFQCDPHKSIQHGSFKVR